MPTKQYVIALYSWEGRKATFTATDLELPSDPTSPEADFTVYGLWPLRPYVLHFAGRECEIILADRWNQRRIAMGRARLSHVRQPGRQVTGEWIGPWRKEP